MTLVKDQGLVAVLLAYQIVQNSRERKALLAKNCELSQFIMKLLEKKIDEDSTNSHDVKSALEPRRDAF